jgi:exodeoxyribonuclease-3
MLYVICIPISPCTRFGHAPQWERDAGLRLDHFLLSPNLKKELVKGGVDRAVRGKVGASDHAPAWIVLDR